MWSLSYDSVAHGFTLIADPESFLVDKESRLEPGEAGRAKLWGAAVSSALLESD